MNIDPSKYIIAQGLINNAVAFHEAGSRCYREAPLFLAPAEQKTFLGAPSVVCYAFSIELYLKLASLLVMGTYNDREHRLDVLYNLLPENIRVKIQEHYGLILPPMGQTVAEELEDASRAFVQWRYVHEGGSLVASPHLLAYIGTAIHRTVRDLAPNLVSGFETLQSKE